MSEQTPAQWSIFLGKKYPYDAPDNWMKSSDDVPPVDNTDIYLVAARGILADLTDRRDIKRGFENVDDDIRVEIVATLAAIIKEAVTQKQGEEI